MKGVFYSIHTKLYMLRKHNSKKRKESDNRPLRASLEFLNFPGGHFMSQWEFSFNIANDLFV
jgi:hypothetical protein